jgi:hypothetical protein
MSKTLMLAAVLLLSATWLQAQQDQGAGQTNSPSSNTVEGCLQGSNGNYTLTDSAGTTYQLAGDTSKLTEHVGHEVEIKGSTSPSSSASTGASSQPTLTVDSVKHVSKTCKAMTK